APLLVRCNGNTSCAWPSARPPAGPTRDQDLPPPGGTPGTPRPLPPGRRPGRSPPCPHPAAARPRPPVAHPHCGPVLLGQHHQPVEAAVRGGRGRRRLRPPSGPAAGWNPPLGIAGGPVGADALPDRVPVRPQPVVVRGGGRRPPGGLPGEG